MNFDVVRSKNETGDLIISITKSCETFIKHTHRNAEETLEIKLTKQEKLFPPNHPIAIDGPWLVGLTSLEVCKSIFNITEENDKFEHYTNKFDKFLIEELKDEPEEILSFSDITPKLFQHEN